MSRRWIEANREAFARDILRDFCMASRVLEEQFYRFQDVGVVSFTAIRDLLGSVMNKGLMWRLKDTAHHLFRTTPGEPPVARMLDWSIGYIFHECIKLKEDAYQHQHYAPLYKALQRLDLSPELREQSDPLGDVLGQTQESLAREVERIDFLLSQSRDMLCLYYANHSENKLLARQLYDTDEMVRGVFKDGYATLIRNTYGEQPERMYLQAAESLLDGGWPEEALEAVNKAQALNRNGDYAELTERAQRLLATTSPRRANNQ